METKQNYSKYSEQRKWSDIFIPEIKKIIGPMLLSVSDEITDTKHNADLVIINTKIKNIACRVRQNRYLEKYPYEFTIRSGASYGGKTEITKIREGFGDWFFYGFAGKENNGKIDRYFLIDLDIFRKYMDEIYSPRLKNPDGTYFNAYDIKQFPTEMIIRAEYKEKGKDYIKPGYEL